jgi:hypothetical protein
LNFLVNKLEKQQELDFRNEIIKGIRWGLFEEFSFRSEF